MVRRGKHDAGDGKKKQRRGGQGESAGLGYRLAEGAIQRVVAAGRFAMTGIGGLGDSGWRRVMDMNLGDVSLQGKGSQNQPDGEAPSPITCLCLGRGSFH